MQNSFLRGSLQLFSLIGRYQRIDDLIKHAVQDRIQLVERKADAVVRQTALRIV